MVMDGKVDLNKAYRLVTRMNGGSHTGLDQVITDQTHVPENVKVKIVTKFMHANPKLLSYVLDESQSSRLSVSRSSQAHGGNARSVQNRGG